ncbi:uncharacterized protein N7483_005889 [Penicillium malachiteum]|uniref:uncharacterized protein n=1 Tax=Penicillium malachiteum TaxID=1324776 RepID=UPI0025476717|nr:uncharacterized protein N7483_005889 [Penicillium malachiteum]KAJ5731381.1 hypothetical protein N7483_005889 [Penicillium malachiteum]
MVEILGPLPARPPTPPRPGSRIDESETEIETPNQTLAATPQTVNSTRVAPSSRGSKQVGWSPYLCTTIELPDPLKPVPKDSPFMRKDPKPWASPFKSILKESNSPIPVFAPQQVDITSNSESLTMLLESVIQQLAGESITSRRDAYMQFFNTLRTYDRLPSTKAIAEKLSLITSFIQRDVSRDSVNGPVDTNVANQALKLANAFVWHSDVASQLSEDFKVFLVDHGTTSLYEVKAPKSVLTHYMSILSSQNFGPRVMTNARIIRLLTALQDITKHVSGKGIALHRLSIYQRLLSQSRSTFVSQATLWVEHLVSGLLNPIKDTRLKAINLGFEIAIVMGPNYTLSRSLRDLFDQSLDRDRKLITEVKERMGRMMPTAESGVHVPQIWSVIILLLRSKNWNLEQWEHFKDWLLVLQRCFNCSEPSIKGQAILGWNRFIYAMNPNEFTDKTLLKMLSKPILSQFERRKSDKPGSAPAQLARESYYNLLYYTFRPSPSQNHLDFIWEEFIANPTTSTFSSVSTFSDMQARVLTHILWSPQLKIWSESRINDVSKIRPEELPSIDSKWVRSRVSTILKVFESLLKASVWDDNDLAKSNIALAWSSLASALSLASSKEITPSSESMQAVASVLALLQRLWNAGPSSLNVPDNEPNVFFERIQFLATTMIISLGSIPFTERLLLKASDGSFQSSNTPTHRQSTSGTNLSSPILHLLRAISETCLSSTPTLEYVRLVEGVIQASCKGRISRGSRLELLQQCADLPKPELSSSPLLAVVWKASARAAADALQSFPMESARERDGSVSRDYDNVTKILASGLKLQDVFQEWTHLLSSFVRVARTEKGEHNLPALIIEPLAEILINLPVQDTTLPSASLLSQSLSIPFLQGNDEGNMYTVAQQMQPIPFPTKLVESIGRTLRFAYDGFNASQTQGLARFIESLTSFLVSGALRFRSRLLETLQPALISLVQDKEFKFSVDNGADSRILTSCRALTFAIINVLQSSVRDDVPSMKPYNGVICAGLESSHASRVKRFADFWSSTASHADEASAETSIGESFKAALHTLNLIELSGKSTENTLPILAAQRPIDGSISRVMTASASTTSQKYAQFNSSPVIGPSELLAPGTSESVDEPQLPANIQSENSGNYSISSFPGNRRDIFQMIDSIRSSSPANTPGGLGFDTPVHLRRLRASHSASEVPLTPTLALAENEEAFIGSSPTPATRDPTPAVNIDAPVLQPHDLVMDDVADIPSSPPEITSRSPSPSKISRLSKNARRRSARRERARRSRSASTQRALNGSHVALLDDTAEASSVPVTEDPKENDAAPQVDQKPLNKRTRSALSQSTENDQNSEPAATPSGTPVRPIEGPSARSSRSKSASRKKKKSSTKPEVDNGQQQVEQSADEGDDALPTPVVPDYLDSGDDLDMQIASQLSQDLVLAADQCSQPQETQEEPQEEPSIEAPTPSQSTRAKKRKRSVDDEPSTAASEKRRSTRLSTAKELIPVDLEEDAASLSQEPDISQSSHESLAVPVPEVSTSTPTPRRSTRNSQRKDDSGAPDPPTSPKPIDPALMEVESQESTQPSPVKPARKSLRSEKKSTPVKESIVPSQSTRSTRSTRSSQRQGDSQTLVQSESTTSEPFIQQLERPHVEIVSDLILPEIHETADVPPVSTEELTDSQETDSAPPVLDEQMDVDTETISNDDAAEPVTTITTAAIQTDSIPPPEPDTSEAGITESLKNLLNTMKHATLGQDALREIDDLLFNIRVEAHDASKRHNPNHTA